MKDDKKIHEDGAAVKVVRPALGLVWANGHFCWASALGTELEGSLGAEETGSQRMGKRLVAEMHA